MRQRLRGAGMGWRRRRCGKARRFACRIFSAKEHCGGFAPVQEHTSVPLDRRDKRRRRIAAAKIPWSGKYLTETGQRQKVAARFVYMRAYIGCGRLALDAKRTVIGFCCGPASRIR